MVRSRYSDCSAADLRRVLSEIWCEVLRVDSIDLHEDFFDLAGDSINAVMIVARVRDRLGVEFQSGAVFEHPTIERLAVLIETTGGVSA